MPATRTSRICLSLVALLTVAAGRVCPIPEARFDSGCYTGDGAASRFIQTNINPPGLLIVAPKRNFPSVSEWWSPEMGAGLACAMANHCNPIDHTCSQCGAGRITNVTNCGFTVSGTALPGLEELNDNAQDYCWYEWQFDPAVHTTFSYMGDGSTPRTIGLPFTPEFVAVQLANGNSANFQNEFYFRTEAMPTNTSFVLAATIEQAGQTQFIRSLVTNGFTVGSGADENGKLYRGFAFRGAPDYGQVISWSGTGTGFDAGRCASAGDVQTINAGVVARMVIAGGCTEIACNGTSCLLHNGADGGWRSTNIGISVVGPGHIAGSDFYQQLTGQPDHGSIGNLSGTSFQVRGGGTSSSSLNDNGAQYYGFVFGPPTPSFPIGCPTPTP